MRGVVSRWGRSGLWSGSLCSMELISSCSEGACNMVNDAASLPDDAVPMAYL